MKTRPCANSMAFAGLLAGFLFVSLASAVAERVQDLPKPTEYVNDFAHVLSLNAATRLDPICVFKQAVKPCPHDIPRRDSSVSGGVATCRGRVQALEKRAAARKAGALSCSRGYYIRCLCAFSPGQRGPRYCQDYPFAPTGGGLSILLVVGRRLKRCNRQIYPHEGHCHYRW